MPLWATVIVVGIVVSTGAGLLKTQLNIQRELGGITANRQADSKRIDDLERANLDHVAEHVAARNRYWERPRPRWNTSD